MRQLKRNSFSHIVWLALVFFLAGCVVSSAGPSATPTPVTVSFSELVANPDAFDGMNVCTEGVYVSGFETTSLGATTVTRDGLTYLTEPTIWIEGAAFTAKDDCFSPGGGAGSAAEFCKARVCGRFEDCGSCGHGGGWRLQIVGAQPQAPPCDQKPATAEPGLDPSTADFVRPGSGPTHEIIFTIPVDKDHVRYQGVGVQDMEITGPNALAVLPDGTFVISDLLDNRLLRYNAGGDLLHSIDLIGLGITNISDLVASETELLVLEINYGVPGTRFRVNRLTFDGALITHYDLPAGLRHADGLTGIAVGGNGEILVELEHGARVFQLWDRQEDPKTVELKGYPFHGQGYRFESPPAPGEGTPTVRFGDVQVASTTTGGLGGMRLLGVRADGSPYIIREDVVGDNPTIRVDQTIHFLNAQGVELGVARYPLADTVYYVHRSMALGADGHVYGLLPQRDALHIVRLIFYERLDPLVPGAAEPRLTKVTGHTQPNQTDDRILLQGTVRSGEDLAEKAFCPDGLYLVTDEGLFGGEKTTLLLRVPNDGNQPALLSDLRYVGMSVTVTGQYPAQENRCEALLCDCEAYILVQEITPAVEDDVSLWPIYRHKALGVQISFPPGWKVDETPALARFSDPQVVGGSLDVVNAGFPMSTPAEFVDFLGPPAVMTYTMTLDGQPALYVELQPRDTEDSYRAVVAVLTPAGQGLTIGNKAEKTIFHKALSSIRFFAPEALSP